jgi:hypothetical protein
LRCDVFHSFKVANLHGRLSAENIGGLTH